MAEFFRLYEVVCLGGLAFLSGLGLASRLSNVDVVADVQCIGSGVETVPSLMQVGVYSDLMKSSGDSQPAANVPSLMQAGVSSDRMKSFGDSQPDVDIVIAASLPTDTSIMGDATDANAQRDRDNGELKYTLRAIKKHAPWVRRIFLLMNGDHSLPTWVPEQEKTEIVNRCAFLPPDLSLPPDQCTRNSCVAQSLVPKIPGLSEHFIYTDDDNLLMRSASKADFFARGSRPRYWPPGAARPVYDHPENTPLSLEMLPQRMVSANKQVPHTWVPMTKTACAEFESRYSDWLAFVRSHRTGRYSSALNESGTAASEKESSVEEFMAPVWWAWLQLKHEGAKSGQDKFIDTWMGVFDESVQGKLETHPPFIQNINDAMASDQGTYEKQRAIEVKTLEALFP